MDTHAGDRIDIGLYLLEGGQSSERLLAALEEAGSTRGVRVNFQLDVSYVSMISRIVEKTDTLVDRVASLAEAQPHWCSCTWGSKPDHGKYACFQRQAPREDSAILGGMNLGDRFTDWDDFAVLLPAPYAGQLRESLLEEGDAGATSTSVLKLGAASWDSSSINAARTIAVISPPVTLITTLTVAGLTATLALVPLTSLANQPVALAAALSATIALGAAAAYFGTAFATAADGGSFSLGYEMRMFVRSLVFDRSWLGDRLAMLRPLYRDASAVAAAHAAATAPRDERLLPMPPLPSAEHAVNVVCNRRMQGRYEVEPTFRSLFANEHLTHYRITMAYLGHRWGVELLEYALKRGAKVDLLLPARANVYAHENLKAAQTLVDADWPSLRLYLHPEMVHAKATLAWEDGPAGAADGAIAFLGSANLVRGSLNLPVHCGLLPYDELNVLVRDPAFCNVLNASMDDLFAQAKPVQRGQQLIAESEWYEEVRAQREELFQ